MGLYIIIVGVALLIGIGCVIMYIESIKRDQRATLEAFLKLSQKRQAESASIVIPRQGEADTLFMQKIVQYIEANIADSDLSVNSLAQATATSASGLNRRMKRIVNVTPAEFIKRVRLERAARLLSSTDMPIGTIALDCGFSDSNYFAKCFKALKGQTPTEFRRGE